MFFNTLASGDKNPIQGCEILRLLIQMQLSKKRKTFAEVFVAFMEFTSNFKHFQTKDDRHS